MSKINNAFYETLGEQWLGSCDHPIGLLRAENAIRNPWIAENIGPSSTVLDIGCGGGILTNFLATRGHKTQGIDLSAESLKIAKNSDTTQSVIYQLANASNLPYPDASFDAVCAMDLLEHVENPEQVIAEASRILKKGGKFFFHTFNRNFFSWFLVIKGVEWCIPNTPPHMHVYSLFIKPKELTFWCQKNALLVKEIKGLRPAFGRLSFWKMIFTRKIPADLSFIFTRELTTGYCGYCIKDSDK